MSRRVFTFSARYVTGHPSPRNGHWCPAELASRHPLFHDNTIFLGAGGQLLHPYETAYIYSIPQATCLHQTVALACTSSVSRPKASDAVEIWVSLITLYFMPPNPFLYYFVFFLFRLYVAPAKKEGKDKKHS